MNPSRCGFLELPLYLIAMTGILGLVWMAVILGYAGYYCFRKLQKKREQAEDRLL